MIADVRKLVLELVVIIRLIETVFVVMLHLQIHHHVLVAATVNQTVVVEPYAMIVVAIPVATLVVQQHVQTVLVLDHVVLQLDVATLRMDTHAFKFKH